MDNNIGEGGFLFNDDGSYPDVHFHDPESDFIDSVEKAIIQVDKKNTKDSVWEVPPILPRRSGRYPWGQSVNNEDPNKEEKSND